MPLFRMSCLSFFQVSLSCLVLTWAHLVLPRLGFFAMEAAARSLLVFRCEFDGFDGNPPRSPHFHSEKHCSHFHSRKHCSHFHNGKHWAIIVLVRAISPNYFPLTTDRHAVDGSNGAAKLAEDKLFSQRDRQRDKQTDKLFGIFSSPPFLCTATQFNPCYPKNSCSTKSILLWLGHPTSRNERKDIFASICFSLHNITEQPNNAMMPHCKAWSDEASARA